MIVTNWSGKICKAPVKSSPSTNQHLLLFTGRMPFLSPHQRYHSTEGKSITFHELAYTKLTWGLLMLSLTTGQGVPSFSSAACVDTWWAASWCTVIQSQYVTSNMVLPLTLYPTRMLKSLYWLKIKQCIRYKLLFLLRIKLSTMQNLCTSMISSPFNPPETNSSLICLDPCSTICILLP